MIDKVSQPQARRNTGGCVERDDNQRTVDACLEVMDGIDVLVNNAGPFWVSRELGQIEISKMNLFDTNVFGWSISEPSFSLVESPAKWGDH
ncbi:MAG: hypothetical protein Ct9H300mP25_05630 [Acidobacteriota bacterium]|nr:MAG: hypothetical protein Ct9H300mP25_05630 [Acidobacteriota bacterium]